MEIAALVAGIAAGRTELAVGLTAQTMGAQARDEAGIPVLRWCAHHGDLSAVCLLLAAGASRNDLGENLGLHEAAFHGHVRLVAWCLEQGANPSHRLSGSDETPLHAALCKANRPTTDRVVDLLLASGADVHATTVAGAPLDSFMRDVRALGETPLHRAAAYASEAVIAALLAAGASREVRDIAGQTPLAWASWHLRPDAILRQLCYGPHRIHAERRSTYDHGTGWTQTELSG